MKLNTVAIIVFLTILNSCGSAASRSESEKCVDSDSVAADIQAQPVVERLPDTAYASVANLQYKVEILADSVSGNVGQLQDLYAPAPGVFTFRGGLQRRADFDGTVSGTPSAMKVEWVFRTQEDYSETSVGRWGGGSGWTGQPLYVEW
ncbi:MAG: hypothetical protein K2L85_09645, partial [Paramuribaculum sp.]|nr:hypothetical protein [Paramuribaculum sp.]